MGAATRWRQRVHGSKRLFEPLLGPCGGLPLVSNWKTVQDQKVALG